MKTSTRKAKEPQLPGTDRIMLKFDLKKGMSINRAIVFCSAYLDSQPDPTKASNAVVQTLEIPFPFFKEPSQAKIMALAAIEQLLLMDVFDPVAAGEIANAKFERIQKKMPYAVQGEAINKSRRGAKRDVARQIYMENRDMDEKLVIAQVAKELDISPQNAYTYIYLVKKSLKI